MKKLLLTTSLAVAGLVAYGQGTINFNNATSTYGAATPSHLISFGTTASLVNSSLVAGGLVGNNSYGVDLSALRAQLYYGSTTATSIGSLTAVTSAAGTFRVSTSLNVGSWVGGGIRTLVGFDVGATVNAAVIVWDSTKYADGLAAFNAANSTGLWDGLYGTSGIFTYTVPAAGSLPSAYFMSNQGAFTIGGAVPEPSTMALAGLGAAALLIFRRRK